jgi:hypothetical protein
LNILLTVNSFQTDFFLIQSNVCHRAQEVNHLRAAYLPIAIQVDHLQFLVDDLLLQLVLQVSERFIGKVFGLLDSQQTITVCVVLFPRAFKHIQDSCVHKFSLILRIV